MNEPDVSTPFALSGEPRPAYRSSRARLVVVGLLGVAAVCAVVAVALTLSPRGGSSTSSSDASAADQQSQVQARPPPVNRVFSRGGGSSRFQASSPSSGPVLIRSVMAGDVDVYAEVPSRFNAQFSQTFIDYVNSQNPKDSNGNPLHFTRAAILGFPPSPVPLEGHVTHDFMTQTGGLHVNEKVPITFAKVDPQFTPTLVNSYLFKQDSPEHSTHTLTYTESFTSSQTLSVTAGISTSVTVEESVKVPVIEASSKLSTTMTASMSTTSSNTESTTQTWSSQEQIIIPPNSLTNGTCFLSKGTVSTPFSGVMSVTDDSNIGWVFYDDRQHTGRDPWFWFWQSMQTGAGLRQAIQWSGSSMSMDFDVSGIYTGVAGVAVQCEVHACKYEPDVTQCAQSNI